MQVPLDVGPRHFEAQPGESLEALRATLRRGDRLRLTLPPGDESADSKKEHKKMVKRLMDAGVGCVLFAVA